ncbi:hypothetical protein ACJIZ3_014593 [Penstemon smallii]|uniref:Uncharacterized protein n=1 Tax=Penstemon smallii TaxID=265156 RepID=A0ABD3RK79_9LAMI
MILAFGYKDNISVIKWVLDFFNYNLHLHTIIIF